MIYQVTIYDPLTHREHVSTWQVTDNEGPLGAANAGFVQAFGNSPGQPVMKGASLLLRGMRVDVVPVVAIPRASFKRRDRDREMGRAAA